MLNRLELKKEAKTIRSSAKQSALVMTLIYLLVDGLLELIQLYVKGTEGMVTLNGTAWQLPLFNHTPFPTAVVLFVSVLVYLLSCVLGAGWVLYHQGVRKGHEMPYSTLFEGFAFAGKIILLNIVMTVFIILWTMLLIIPGIIAAYRYRFALFNLCENPEIGVMEAISMSKQQTKGRKLDLFVLDLTFIGWELLCCLTCGILLIWVLPYIQQTNLGYFEVIKQEKGIGVLPEPPAEDDTFHPDDRF